MTRWLSFARLGIVWLVRATQQRPLASGQVYMALASKLPEKQHNIVADSRKLHHQLIMQPGHLSVEPLACVPAARFKLKGI